MKRSDLKTELEHIIEYQTRTMRYLAGSDNPQTIKEHDKLAHSTAAFQAVLDRINGGMSLTLFF